MLSDLKFLTAAVARKDFVEELCHVHIHKQHSWSYDGVMSIHTKLNVTQTIRPHAVSFIKAVSACDEEKNEIQIHPTKAGRLAIQAGKFKAFIPCIDNDKPGLLIPKPEGPDVPITPELFDSIKKFAPLMSLDASRPWAQGLRIVGNHTYVTNNIILAEYSHGSQFPLEIIIPAEFVKTVLKIDQIPIKAQATEHCLTFHYPEERWIRTQLVAGGWPANLDKIFRTEPGTRLSEDFFPALERLKPFMDDRGRVFIFNDRIATTNVEEEGASVDIEETNLTGVLFHLEQLQLLHPIMTTINLASYPAPSAWYGENIRGVIVGLKA